jgi:hypothetical protein
MKEMKIKRRDEELIKVGLRIPLRLKEQIAMRAIEERRSANDEFIVLMEKALKEKEGGSK